MILGLVGCLILILIAYPFIIIIFGQKFIGAFIPTLLLLPGLIAMTLNYSYSNFFSAINKPFLSAGIFAIGLVINILLNITLLNKFGIIGAAIFSSIAYIIITVGFIFVILKTNKELTLKEIAIPRKEDFKYFISKFKNYIPK
jgi:O-antigen/teichoic acid export membrane protein